MCGGRLQKVVWAGLMAAGCGGLMAAAPAAAAVEVCETGVGATVLEDGAEANAAMAFPCTFPRADANCDVSRFL